MKKRMGSASSALALALPQELLERILLHLPLSDLLRSRTVCKRWRALTSTRQFANARSSISHLTQLLVLCNSSSPHLACFAYDFQSCSWHKLPLDFLPEGYSPLTSPGAHHASFRGSVGGLLVVDILNRRGGAVSTYLCNPFTRSFLTVPRSPTAFITQARGFVVDNVANSFKVVVVGSPMDDCPYRSNDFIYSLSTDSPMTQVFDSSSNSWTTTQGLLPGYHVYDEFLTFRDGFLYSTTTCPSAVMIYNLQQGNWTDLEMPRPDENRSFLYTMMNCNGRLLTAGGKISDIGAIEYIMMWELDPEKKTWEELGKMPRELFDLLIIDRERNWFECFAVGNRICFRSLRNLNILMYELCEKSWSWLPICPFSREMNGDGCVNLPVKGFGLQPQTSGDLLSTYTEASRKFPRPLLIQSPSSTTAGFLPS